MAIFDYPRFNVKGLIQVNVGTANNDDYSGYQFPSGNFYPGQPVRLADSKNVQPMRYGMDDDKWVAWAQSSIPVYDPPPSSTAAPTPKFFARYEAEPANNNVIPGEWNYYGDMGLTMMNVKLTGINDPNGNVNAGLATLMKAATLSFNNRAGSNGRSTAMLIDINPEDPTNSQVFTDNLAMMTDTQIVFNGKPSKAMTRWINFTRNANLTGPNGAAASFQCVVPLSELQGQAILQGLPATSPTGKALAGIVCRYTLYRPLQVYNYFKYTPSQWIAEMIQLYKTKGTNADFLELQGTIAPWFEGDAVSQTTGRLLNPIPFPAPPDFKGNGAPGQPMRVAPAIARLDEKRSVLSVDCSASFPDYYKGTDKYDPMITGNNPKYDIGPMTMDVIPKGSMSFVRIGVLDYMDMPKNDANGWIFDFPLDAALLKIVQEGQLCINCNGKNVKGTILKETPLLIFSEQSGVYGEQVNTPGAKSTNFRYDAATNTSVSFIAYRNGVRIPSGDGQKFTLYYYDTTPNQQPGPRMLLQDNYVLGNPIGMPVSSAGNILVTCVPVDAPPPIQYGNFDPLTGSILNLRVLPNNIDYSQYYKDPNAPIPEGNDKLTFEVIYDLVLRNYYLLYPAMSKVVKLNDPLMWEDATMARELMNRLSLPAWPTAISMPRTRDLSDSRRKLLTAWCLKIINRKPNPSSPKYTHP